MMRVCGVTSVCWGLSHPKKRYIGRPIREELEPVTAESHDWLPNLSGTARVAHHAKRDVRSTPSRIMEEACSHDRGLSLVARTVPWVPTLEALAQVSMNRWI